jgi:hypothetical protein
MSPLGCLGSGTHVVRLGRTGETRRVGQKSVHGIGSTKGDRTEFLRTAGVRKGDST